VRRSIVAIGAGLFLTLGSAAALAASSDTASTTAASASGPAWCGFHNKAGDRVRCGFSSETGCRKAIGGADAVCIVDPYLT
jgi:hypothetical protein